MAKAVRAKNTPWDAKVLPTSDLIVPGTVVVGFSGSVEDQIKTQTVII